MHLTWGIPNISNLSVSGSIPSCAPSSPPRLRISLRKPNRSRDQGDSGPDAEAAKRYFPDQVMSPLVTFSRSLHFPSTGVHGETVPQIVLSAEVVCRLRFPLHLIEVKGSGFYHCSPVSLCSDSGRIAMPSDAMDEECEKLSDLADDLAWTGMFSRREESASCAGQPAPRGRSEPGLTIAADSARSNLQRLCTDTKKHGHKSWLTEFIGR
ncbi:hypothetical protein AAFF_G00002140 [Aldrovandia affinis]|uniref:Uncharacterized protein n=1 Tax=Aldrovandia affinis TaxID=143900 RepID=A0AAD7TD02_9TELE|nr:hypothetical protein AAFF_G00002140 [Aldrovandia affinis]